MGWTIWYFSNSNSIYSNLEDFFFFLEVNLEKEKSKKTFVPFPHLWTSPCAHRPGREASFPFHLFFASSVALYLLFLLLSIIFLSLYPCFLMLLWPLEIRHKLHNPIQPLRRSPHPLFVFMFFVSFQQLPLVLPTLIHCVLSYFWIDVKFEIFWSRSSLLHPFLQDTHLTNRFFGVPGFQRRSPLFPPPLAYQRVANTRPRVLCSHQRVVVVFALTAFLRFDHRWSRTKPAIPAVERPPLGGAWIPCTIGEGSHSSSYRTPAVYLTVFGFICVFSGCAAVLLWFMAVLVLWLGLFEPFCHLKPLRAALGKAQLVCDSSGVMGDNHCLLLLVCFCVWLPFLLEFSWFCCSFWINCWGAHPFFVCRILNFFFHWDQKWKWSSPITFSSIN